MKPPATFNKSLRPYDGHYPVLGNRVWVDPDAVVIGKVTLGDDVSVWPGAVIRGDVAAITVGAGSNVQDQCVLHVTHDGPYSPGGRGLDIGQGVTVGHAAVLHACSISDYCLIGIGATLLDDVEVGDHCMIGAGALVPAGKRIESGWLWHGSPARAVRRLSDEELARLEYSAAHYIRIKDKYRAGDESTTPVPGEPNL